MSDVNRSGPGWAVVVTWANAEALAQRSIEALGFTVVTPTFMIMARPGGRGSRATQLEIVSKPLISGYVFAEMMPDQDDFSRPVPGVSRLLRYPSRRLKLIPAALMTKILRESDDGVFDKLPASKIIGGNVGDSVRAKAGPFASFIGTLAAVDDDRKRAEVLFSIFGRATKVEFLKPEDLEVVETEEALA